MSAIFQLPWAIFVRFISDWVDVKSLSRLDSATLNQSNRSVLLDVMKNHYTSNGNHSGRHFSWLGLRGIKMKSIYVKSQDSPLDTNFIHQLDTSKVTKVEFCWFNSLASDVHLNWINSCPQLTEIIFESFPREDDFLKINDSILEQLTVFKAGEAGNYDDDCTEAIRHLEEHSRNLTHIQIECEKGGFSGKIIQNNPNLASLHAKDSDVDGIFTALLGRKRTKITTISLWHDRYTPNLALIAKFIALNPQVTNIELFGPSEGCGHQAWWVYTRDYQERGFSTSYGANNTGKLYSIPNNRYRFFLHDLILLSALFYNNRVIVRCLQINTSFFNYGLDAFPSDWKVPVGPAQSGEEFVENGWEEKDSVVCGAMPGSNQILHLGDLMQIKVLYTGFSSVQMNV